MRQRSPGVWEIRVVIGHDPARARSIQRSITVHGDHEHAQRRRELVDDLGATHVDATALGARWTLGDLLERFRDAQHPWKPATVASHRDVVQNLQAARRRDVLRAQVEVHERHGQRILSSI